MESNMEQVRFGVGSIKLETTSGVLMPLVNKIETKIT